MMTNNVDNSPIKLEICVYNMQSCLVAQNSGAQRVELCASMPEGGITPSRTLIEQAKKNLLIDVMVMIRPRGGDFFYDEWEFKQMIGDIDLCRKIGVAGVVFGVLTPEGNVDIQRNKVLLEVAGSMQTCFHRAIDMTKDYEQSAKDITNLGFTRILTSGAMNKVCDGLQKIKSISSLVGNKVEIMVGSGVNPYNIKSIYDTVKPNAFHFSAKKIFSGGMLYKNPIVSMGGFGGISEYDLVISDGDEIKKARNVINSLQMQ
ncbi:MAG: copper homeostasis protein CutC [Bacteroidales bacterium]